MRDLPVGAMLAVLRDSIGAATVNTSRKDRPMSPTTHTTHPSAPSLSRRGFIAGASLAAGATTLAVSTVLTGTALADAAPAAGGIVEAGASAMGFGGQVTVTLAVDTAAGTVVDARIEGPQETSEKGGRAIEAMQAAMVETGSVEVDAVAGASVTSQAVLSASQIAWRDAMGISVDIGSAKMAPGSYTASAKSGYWRIVDLPVTVTVNEDAILDIAVPEDRFAHGDTEVILASVKEQFFPRILRNQSLEVDGVTGATLSCVAVREAARAALCQAFEANGCDPQAVEKFCRPVDLKTELGQVEELEADVLVVGLGNGGVIAVRNAVEKIQELNGCRPVSVVAIDRAGKVGGKSALTHEALAVNPQVYGAFDNGGEEYIDAEDFRARWKHFASTDGQMLAKEELIDLMVDESGKTIDWLFTHGWRYGTVAQGAGFDLAGGRTSFNSYLSSRADPGTYEDRRAAVDKALKQLLSESVAQGAQVMLETEAYELIVEDGVCRGVKARDRITGKEYVIRAKATIMGTGGFSANRAMLDAYLDEPYRGQYKLIGTGCDTCLLVQSAIDNGAGTFNLGMTPILMHCGIDHWLDRYPIHTIEDQLNNRTGRHNVWTLNNIPLGCAYNSLSIAVRHDGRRFMDESQYEAFSKDIDVDSFAHWKGGANYFVILSDDEMQHIASVGFDTTYWDGYNTQGKIPADLPVPEVYEGMGYAIEEGMAWKADTVEELAAQIGVDPAALAETVARYNASCDAT